MQGTSVITTDLHSITTLEDVKHFDTLTRPITQDFIQTWKPSFEDKILESTSKNKTVYTFTYAKVISHIITHGIHHIGQLSIWAKEINLKPVSSDLIIRNYM